MLLVERRNAVLLVFGKQVILGDPHALCQLVSAVPLEGIALLLLLLRELEPLLLVSPSSPEIPRNDGGEGEELNAGGVKLEHLARPFRLSFCKLEDKLVFLRPLSLLLALRGARRGRGLQVLVTVIITFAFSSFSPHSWAMRGHELVRSPRLALEPLAAQRARAICLQNLEGAVENLCNLQEILLREEVHVTVFGTNNVCSCLLVFGRAKCDLSKVLPCCQPHPSEARLPILTELHSPLEEDVQALQLLSLLQHNLVLGKPDNLVLVHGVRRYLVRQLLEHVRRKLLEQPDVRENLLDPSDSSIEHHLLESLTIPPLLLLLLCSDRRPLLLLRLVRRALVERPILQGLLQQRCSELELAPILSHELLRCSSSCPGSCSPPLVFEHGAVVEVGQVRAAGNDCLPVVGNLPGHRVSLHLQDAQVRHAS
mmetsp:Transcript_25771/g.57978  ORF Transcript_25771/g.57978 Transcript_25771/m.57978 type:complete len:426 (-) Transcript_25771:492-1769(-)